jgi:DNA-binding response OmpR family regulator
MTEDRPKIMIVEDDPRTRSFLADNLAADGYEPFTVDSTEQALAAFPTQHPDLVLVDINLPGRDGLELVREVRGSDGIASRLDPMLPLIVLSGHADDLNRVRAINHGADDALLKPYVYEELLARVRGVLRRAEHRARGGRMRIGPLELDPAGRIVRLNGESLPLSQKEYALLRTLATDATKVWTKDELLRSIWGFRQLGSTRTLDSHACRLRRKLARDGERFIINVWRIGYRLCDGPVVAG